MPAAAGLRDIGLFPRTGVRVDAAQLAAVDQLSGLLREAQQAVIDAHACARALAPAPLSALMRSAADDLAARVASARTALAREPVDLGLLVESALLLERELLVVSARLARCAVLVP